MEHTPDKVANPPQESSTSTGEPSSEPPFSSDHICKPSCQYSIAGAFLNIGLLAVCNLCASSFLINNLL